MIEPVVADTAYIVGVNQKSFEKALDVISARVMHFYEMRVSSLNCLSKNLILCELAIHWNTKLEYISPLANLPNLISLVLEHTPKVSDLAPLASCVGLETLEFSGGIWKKNRTESLDPISELPNLRNLRLLNLAVSDGIMSLASLPSLRLLQLSNQFPTEEYAYLSGMFDEVECNYFSPYVEIANRYIEKDVMVIGKRKPFLNKTKDAKKLEKYISNFKRLQSEFSANKNV